MKSLEMSPVIALGLVLIFGSISAAQDRPPVSSITGEPPPGESRIEVGLAFAQALGSPTFSLSQTIREFAEEGRFNAAYKVGSAPGGGFDLQYNLSPKFGLRVGAQTFSRKSTGAFDAQIPHPFFFARPRTVAGSQSGLGFTEAAFSLTGVYRGASGKWRVNLEGGPASFSVNATVAEKLNYSQVYPYDTARFDGATIVKKKVSPLGFAVGLELGRELTRSLGVVVQGRFTQGKGDIDVNGQKTTITAGGAQVRLGLRLVLARKRAGD